MAKLKNVLLLALSFALVAVLAIGGTVAYLTDTDSTVNVMTVGNVKIQQIEQERDAQGNLVDFTQAKPALPAVYETEDWAADGVEVNGTKYKVFADDMKNVIDKIVTVKNTGKSEAFVRTIVAIEAPDYDPEDLIHLNYNGTDVTMSAPITAEINSSDYVIFTFTYKEALAAGKESAPSLVQLFLDKKADNDFCAKFGETWDVLVLSQAVQAQGFDGAATALDTAFGKVADKAAEWFGGMKAPALVSTADELKDALEAGGEVILTDDVTVTSTLNVAAGKDVTINLNGNDLSYAVSNTGASAIISNKGNLEITGSGTLSFVAENPDMQAIPSYATNTITNTGTGTLIIGKGVVVTNGSDGGASYAVDVQSGKFILDGGTLVGERCALRIARFNADAEFIMNDGLVKAATPAWIHLPGSNANDAPKISVVINGGTFQSTKTTSEDNDVLYTYSFGNSHANTSVTINGGEFLGGTVSIGSGYKGDVPSLTINGGTFEYDVLQWLENDASKVLYAANK